MLKKTALWWGIVFVILGIAGFIPGITTTDSSGMEQLFGIFMVDGIHNLVHLLTGIGSLIASTSERWSRLYFQIIGIVYAVVTIIGFILGSGRYVLGFIPVDTADNILHLVIAAAALGLGFRYRPHQVTQATHH